MKTATRLGSIVSGEHIKTGQTVQFAVMGALYFVMKVDDDKIVLFGEDEIITHKRYEGIYYNIFGGQVEPEIMTNVKSGVSHFIINGKSPCGSVGDFTNGSVANTVTCKHCLGVK